MALMSCTSWRGLSMSESSESTTSTSRDSKKPPEAPDSTGTPAAASSRLQTRPDTFALRRSMAISPQRSGLSPPGAVSIVPDSTSSLIRLAAQRASMASLSGLSPSPSAPGSSITHSSGRGTSPGYGRAAARRAFSS